MTSKCCLCNKSDEDNLKYGQLMTYEEDERNRISAHFFCMLFSSNLIQRGEDNDGLLGFLPSDIKKECKRIKRQLCSFCQEDNANIACCNTKCRVFYHMKCGYENNVQYEFKNTFRSFCKKHYTFKQTPFKSKTELCHICQDNLGKFSLVDTLKAPCCKNGWFHRWCLSQYASTSGYFFKCPLCQNEEKIRKVLPLRGVYIPDQDAAWETEPNAFQELLERPKKCSALRCKCNEGREFTNKKEFKLLYCNICGNDSVHDYCSTLINDKYYCGECLPFAPKNIKNNKEDEETEDVDILGINESSSENKESNATVYFSSDDSDNTFSLQRQSMKKRNLIDDSVCSLGDSVPRLRRRRFNSECEEIHRPRPKRNRFRITSDSEGDVSGSSQCMLKITSKPITNYFNSEFEEIHRPRPKRNRFRITSDSEGDVSDSSQCMLKITSKSILRKKHRIINYDECCSLYSNKENEKTLADLNTVSKRRSNRKVIGKSAQKGINGKYSVSTDSCYMSESSSNSDDRN